MSIRGSLVCLCLKEQMIYSESTCVNLKSPDEVVIQEVAVQ